MGCYGIGAGRLMASVVETSNDDDGIVWPMTIAPQQVYLVSLATRRTPEVTEAADRVYSELKEAGIEVLYDDRDERAGVKFNDADLLGIPVRLTIGARGLKNGVVELKLRRGRDSRELPLDGLVDQIAQVVESEEARVLENIKTDPLQ